MKTDTRVSRFLLHSALGFLKITSIPRIVEKDKQVSISVLHEVKQFLQENGIKPHFSHIFSVILLM